MRNLINLSICLVLLFSAGCTISVDYTTLDFGSKDKTKAFELTVVGLVKWSLDCDRSWVTIDPVNGQASQTIIVTVDRNGLAPGNYEAILTISNNLKIPSSEILITMTVEGEPSPLAVEGHVYDIDTGNPIPGVLVYINTNSFATNETGYYMIEVASPGVKTITASKEGYEEYSSNVTVENAVINHDIFMLPSEPITTTSSTIIYIPTTTTTQVSSTTTTQISTTTTSQVVTTTTTIQSTVTVPDVIGLEQTAANNSITSAGLTVGIVTMMNSNIVPAGHVISQDPLGGISVATGSAVDLVISIGLLELPPDPSEVAPPVDPTLPTSFGHTTEFLYTGANPIQAGVVPGTIEMKRAAVIRGKVLNKQGQPVPGVTVSVLNHPEYGETLSRLDGVFDLATNGGEHLTVKYNKMGYLPAQRQVEVPWRDWVWAPDVILTALDLQVTTIDLNAVIPYQVARGAEVTDADGTRQATLLFPQGTQAEMVFPDGTKQALTTLNVRATEYTVGPNGPQAMPAVLPPTSAYTYCVELSVDEALSAGATEVTFTQPINFYLEDFIGFPAGSLVPVGYYDKQKGVWVGSPNGIVVKIVSITGGLADLDTDGDDVADDEATLNDLNISNAEREQLAGLYSTGHQLWRVPLNHFSSVDLNWSPRNPLSSLPQADLPTETIAGSEADPCNSTGNSRIECQNQVLGESIAITGTPFSLNYTSDRVPGRIAGKTFEIQLAGDLLPPEIQQIKLGISIAGNKIEEYFTPQRNLYYTFTWDGLSAYGFEPNGNQPVLFSLSYIYGGYYVSVPLSVYEGTYPGSTAFGTPFNNETVFMPIITATNRVMGSYSRDWWAEINTWNALGQGLGAWNLNVHHAFDPDGKILYLGDGTKRTAESMNSIIETVGIGGLSWPTDLVFAPDGTMYIANSGGHTILRRNPDGTVTRIAGTGTPGYSGDGGPATDAQLYLPTGIEVGPDGSIYFGHLSYPAVRRITPDGIIHMFAGGCYEEGVECFDVSLSRIRDVAYHPDGSFFVADEYNNSIYRLGTDGEVDVYLGRSYADPITTYESFDRSYGMDVAPDGSLLLTESNNSAVLRVRNDGIVERVAGTGSSGYSEDGIPATEAQLEYPWDVEVSPDGGFYLSEGGMCRIRKVSSDGIINTVAGNGTCGNSGDGGPATNASINWPYGIALSPDGYLYIADGDNNRIRRVKLPMPGFSNEDIVIASKSGKELYVFNQFGKHQRTINTLTGATVYEFGYNENGQLVTIQDLDGNITTIERDPEGNPTAIVSPYGQNTTLTLDSNGYLFSITSPGGDIKSFSYTTDGLLTDSTDPNGNISTYTYDNLGQLIQTEDPAGGQQILSRIDFQTGYEASRTTALGRTTTYSVEQTPTDDTILLNTFPNGLQTRTLVSTDGSQTTTLFDGTIISQISSPDRRFGMQSPIITGYNISTPGGLRQTVTKSRTVVLSDPNDPLSLSSKLETIIINDQTFTSTYNAATSQIIITSPVGRQTIETIDPYGRIVSKEVSGLTPAFYAYDDQGRLRNITYGTGDASRIYELTYDVRGFVSSITDPLLRSRSLEYDGAGRVTSEVTQDGRELLFAYDSNGNIISITPAGRPAHLFSYTPVNLMNQYVPPDVNAGTNSTIYTFNLDRQLTQISRPDGLVVVLEYDDAGRLLILSTDRGITNYTYDPSNGYLWGMSTPEENTLAFTYDGFLVTGYQLGGAVTGTINQLYDDNYRIAARSINGGQTISFTYDDDGLLLGAGSLSLIRNANNGFITGSTLGNTNDTITYNEFGELESYSASYGSTPLFSEQYTRDKLGRIIQSIETVGGTTYIYDYFYDLAGQLEEVKKDGVTISLYVYDVNGNRLSHNGTTATYDDQDRLMQYGNIQYEYTANGELLTKTDIISHLAAAYNYDAYGNLMQVILPDGNVVEYLIDGFNRRIGKKVNGTLEKGFLYNEGLDPIAELDGNNSVISRFIYASKHNVPEYMVKYGNTYRIISDHLGSPRMVINISTGVIEQQIDYDEFGNVISDTNPDFQPFGFAGGLYDPDTQLLRFGARDYDASTGRWTSKDPILFSGLSMNLYGYVLNDPINFFDTNGLQQSPARSDCYLGAAGIVLGVAGATVTTVATAGGATPVWAIWAGGILSVSSTGIGSFQVGQCFGSTEEGPPYDNEAENMSIANMSVAEPEDLMCRSTGCRRWNNNPSMYVCNYYPDGPENGTLFPASFPLPDRR